VTSSITVREAAMDIQRAFYKIVNKIQKKEKRGDQRNFYMNFHRKCELDCLIRRTGAR